MDAAVVVDRCSVSASVAYNSRVRRRATIIIIIDGRRAVCGERRSRFHGRGWVGGGAPSPAIQHVGSTAPPLISVTACTRPFRPTGGTGYGGRLPAASLPTGPCRRHSRPSVAIARRVSRARVIMRCCRRLRPIAVVIATVATTPAVVITANATTTDL